MGPSAGSGATGQVGMEGDLDWTPGRTEPVGTWLNMGEVGPLGERGREATGLPDLHTGTGKTILTSYMSQGLLGMKAKGI